MSSRWPLSAQWLTGDTSSYVDAGGMDDPVGAPDSPNVAGGLVGYVRDGKYGGK